MTGHEVDGVLVQWGERLFYPANRMVKGSQTPRLDAMGRHEAAVIRLHIEATVRRAPQVMVRVTGGGRGMGAIAAHFGYISKSGRLCMEDDRGVERIGKEAVCDVVDQWRHAGTRIDDVSPRREAFNIMLSMPAGTNAALLKKAAHEFAQVELAGHRYVMVLHEHQANPHVHLSVRAEAATGKRLSPRRADLRRWRETFAEKLRGCGIDADATRQVTRGESRRYEPLWRLRAKEEGRLRVQAAPRAPGSRASAVSADAMTSWAHILQALAVSDDDADRALAKRISGFVRGSAVFKEAIRRRTPQGPTVSQEAGRTSRDEVLRRAPDRTHER